jgi:hypothetical protein
LWKLSGALQTVHISAEYLHRSKLPPFPQTTWVTENIVYFWAFCPSL